jgi:hypothetical protein
MSHEAIAKIFALQQEEQRKNEEAARKNRERADRERRALADSPVMEILRALQDVPLKKELAGCYGANQKFTTLIQYYRDELFAGKVNELMMKMYSGATARWTCRECRDSGRMMYEHRTGDLVLVNEHRPDKGFVETFIGFAARCLDPQAIADKLGQTPATQPAANQGRRILQAT